MQRLNRVNHERKITRNVRSAFQKVAQFLSMVEMYASSNQSERGE